MKPQYILIAGVNGCGKSTLTHLIPDFDTIPKINLDDKIRSLGDWRDRKNFLIAGREVLQEIQSFFGNHVTFIQETTLCGHAIRKRIDTALQNDYDVVIHFIGLDTYDIAQDRVHHRVKNGGHGIPDEDIRRRYYEGMNALNDLIPKCSQIIFYDNSDAMKRFLKLENGQIVWQSLFMPDWLYTYFPDLSAK